MSLENGNDNRVKGDFDEDPHNILVPKLDPSVPQYITLLERGSQIELSTGHYFTPLGVKLMNLKNKNQYVWMKMVDGYLCIALTVKGDE